MDLIEAKIESLSKKGHGVATYAKENSPVIRKVEIPGTSLGDEVLIEVPKGRRRVRKALLKELLHPSSIRTNPKCIHVGTCGGCVWQQNVYKWQLTQKESRIKELFPGHPVEPITGMENPWHYRGKMEHTFSEDREGNRFLGLNQAGGRGKVVDLQQCYIGPTWALDLLKNVRTWWQKTHLRAYYPPLDAGSLQNLTIRSAANTEAKMVILTVSGNASYALNRKEIDTFAKIAAVDEETSVYLLIKSIAKGRPTRFYEMHLAGPEIFREKLLNVELSMTPQAFFQPNSKMAEKMFTKALELIRPQKDERLLDLYCGIGTIGILFAPYVEMVVGVEIVPSAICDARYNVDALGLENVQMFRSDVETFISDPQIHHEADIVIVDPPRVGLDAKTIAYLNHTRPKKFLYISCNPTTQAEDIKQLKGAKILQIVPFDQFPHTPHIENIIFLTFE